MGKYEKYKHLILPANIVKTQVTSSVLGVGKKGLLLLEWVTGIDLGEWFQEQIDNGDIVITVPGTGTDLSFLRTSTDVTIYSSTGTDITIQGAGSTLAGFMTASDKINLTGLLALDGVANGATNLGTFTGTIISDNNTIKGALQELETAIQSYTPVITTGNLTAASPLVIVTGGTNATLSNVTVDIDTSLINLSDLTGTLDLTQLNTTGLTAGDFLTFNGSNIVGSPLPTTFDHNLLTNLQGGDVDEYYHLTNSQHDVLTILNQGQILGRYDAGTGDTQVLTVDGSLTTNFTTQTIELVNDSTSPGNNKVYGTGNTGIKGWFDQLVNAGTVTSISVLDNSNLDFTITGTPTINPTITADLKTTGVTANTYGNSSNVAQFTVDNKGRLSNAVNVPIAITTANITGFDEYVQDLMSTTLVAGTNITLTYNDPSGTITVNSTGGSYTDEQAQDAVGTIMLNTSDVEFTYNDAWPKITAILGDTGVTAGTYGSSSQVPVFVTDVKGRLYSVFNTPISISSTQVSNFQESVEDAVSNLLVAGSNVNLVYNDSLGTLTISATAGAGSGYDSVYHDGVIVTQRTELDFKGDAFIIADNGGTSRTDISLASILEDLADIVTPATGSMLYYTGSAWTKMSPTRDTQNVSSGVTVTLPSTPKTGTIVDVYFNGILQEESVDYTISGATLTFTNTFVSGNKVTTRYYS